MKEWLTVTTSSPGPTPTDRRASARAAVQLATAQAWATPTNAANSRSKASTCGPCASHPDRITARAASLSASPTRGFVIGITSQLDVRTEHTHGAALVATTRSGRKDRYGAG